jgi:hypothetical protein
MKYLIILLVLAVLLILGIKFISGIGLEQLPIKFYSAQISDTADVFEMLEKTGADESYVILAFNSVECFPDSHIELQFSIESGEIGFDWVLLGEEKIRDEEKFRKIASSRGYKIEEHVENGVEYLRVTEGDLVSLCRQIMKDVYKVADDQPVEVIAKNFEVTGLSLIEE